MSGSSFRRLFPVAPASSQFRWRTPAPVVLRKLPALGSVLYIASSLHMAMHEEAPRGLLVESVQLAPLLHTRSLVAAGAITSEGPREWIECVDRCGLTCARLHLLPDTDYLAWDALLAADASPTAARPARGPRNIHAAGAQLLRFHLRQLGGLAVLGAMAPAMLSALSQQMAGQIAATEALPLRSSIGGR